jgi:hypothetical protein
LVGEAGTDGRVAGLFEDWWSSGMPALTSPTGAMSVWSNIGFQALSGDVMILDLNPVTFEDRLRTVRKKSGVD